MTRLFWLRNRVFLNSCYYYTIVNIKHPARTAAAIQHLKLSTIIETMSKTTTSPSSSSTTYPVDDLVPRVDTNALQFVLNNPKYNGKNITIGILDTGIDPGVSTVRYMNDGTTIKLQNVIDCTGSGDVDVSNECKATYTTINKKLSDYSTVTDVVDDEYWSLTGLSGRTIKLHKDWTICPFPVKKKKSPTVTKNDDATKPIETATNESTEISQIKVEDSAVVDETKTLVTATAAETDGAVSSTATGKTVTVRVGVKRAYELFPSSVVRRIKNERSKVLKTQLDTYVASLKEQKAALITKNGSKKLSVDDGKVIQNYDSLLDVLTSSEYTSTDNDPGPIYDCIVYYDGTNYRAIIDTTETGDVRSIKPMTSYDKEYHVETFSAIDQMNYCIQFYNNGTILSIICDTSPHGTHVASIAAGSTATSSSSSSSDSSSNRPGVAPGANLVSLKIGDTRIAFIEAIRNKCDIINMSYGEDVQTQNIGRIYNLACELVYKHNVLFLSSAGNAGPALSTVGSPGGTMSPVIGIAASVSHSMAKSMYNIPLLSSTTNTAGATTSTTPLSSIVDDDENKDDDDDDNETIIQDSTYTWSSTGPSPDGDNGVCITAPGGAITTVSNWTLQKLMLMNGTSMSCPNATGCVSLVLSACKDSNIPISYPRIRRAIENTALPTKGSSIVQEGWGMIQVNKAFEYLQQYKDDIYEDIYYNVKIVNKHNTPRGIYLRHNTETNVKQTISVSIEPQFRRETTISNELQQLKINYEKQFTLSCNESWVTIPQYICLMNSPRDFTIEIDPTKLQPGGPYTTRVVAYDTTRTDKHVMFSVPITVVKPLPIENEYIFKDITFVPSEIKRYFVVPPPGSTFMDVTITDLRQSSIDNDTSAKMIMLHTIQLLPNTSYKQMEKYRRFNILPGQVSVASVAVEEDHTIEVSLSRFWSSIGPTMKFQFQINFRGVKPTPNRLDILPGSMSGGMVRLTSTVNDEMIDPKASLRSWRTPLRPTNAVITPLSSPDDEDADERDVFPASGKTIYQLVLTYNFEQDEKGSFIPRVPVLQGMLYESVFESQIILFFDNDKKYLGMSDMKTESITANKGAVVAKIQIRHDDTTLLEKLQDMILWIERKLPSEISLSAYESKQNLLLGSNTFGKRYLRKGSSITNKM
jgi:tripeptidyl-peptidase II